MLRFMSRSLLRRRHDGPHIGADFLRSLTFTSVIAESQTKHYAQPMKRRLESEVRGGNNNDCLEMTESAEGAFSFSDRRDIFRLPPDEACFG